MPVKTIRSNCPKKVDHQRSLQHKGATKIHKVQQKAIFAHPNCKVEKIFVNPPDFKEIDISGKSNEPTLADVAKTPSFAM